MERLHAFARALIQNLKAKTPDALRTPFRLHEISADLFPYAAARRQLGIDSHEDYEMLLLRLAAGEGGYAATIPDHVAECFAEELAATVPDTTLYRAYPDAQIVFSSEHLAFLEAPQATLDEPPPVSAEEGVTCAECGTVSSRAWEFCPKCGSRLLHERVQYRIAVLAGDGIGPEVVDAALPVLTAAAANRKFSCRWSMMPYSADHYLETGETLPEEVVTQVQEEFDAIFLGALGDPRVPDNAHARAILLGLRFQLDLFINFRPIVLLHPALTPLKGYETDARTIDFAIFRENTEGQYLGRGRVEDDTHIVEEIATPQGVERIIRAAFQWATANDRHRVTMSDKANAIALHRIWQETFNRVAQEFPDLEADHRYIDVLAMELVQEPYRFDVIVTNNLYGDILSDLGAGLVGGLGLAPSANLHPGRTGLFEPVHGSAPTIAKRGVANPLAAILTGALMFDQLGETESATMLRAAVRAALAAGVRPQDLGGTANTKETADAVLNHLA